MTYKKLYEDALFKLDRNIITLGEFEEMTKPLDREVEQEPKTGRWIETHDDWGNGIITDRKYKCSVCHGKHIDPETGEWHEVFDYKYPFCPNCGAKMAETEADNGEID
jgi:hypothetical protein